MALAFTGFAPGLSRRDDTSRGGESSMGDTEEPRLEPPDFEGWYRGAHPRVAGVVAAITGEVDVACDAADEAFTRAYERWERVSRMDSSTAWTVQVALNVARRRLRRRAIERGLLRRGAPREASPPPEPSDEQLWAAVRALPRRQRETVVLRHVGDLTTRDIAVVLRVSAGTVSTNLREAHRKLGLAVSPDGRAATAPAHRNDERSEDDDVTSR